MGTGGSGMGTEQAGPVTSRVRWALDENGWRHGDRVWGGDGASGKNVCIDVTQTQVLKLWIARGYVLYGKFLIYQILVLRFSSI